jgi:hypothetical protein
MYMYARVRQIIPIDWAAQEQHIILLFTRLTYTFQYKTEFSADEFTTFGFPKLPMTRRRQAAPTSPLNSFSPLSKTLYQSCVPSPYSLSKPLLRKSFLSGTWLRQLTALN